MAGLQRSAVSFRRQGSSGIVWDDKILAAELNHKEGAQSHNPELQFGVDTSKEQCSAPKASSRTAGSVERSRSVGGGGGGGQGFRTGRVSPAVDPPSPKVSTCGFCGAFRKHKKARRRLNSSAVKREM